MYVCIYVCMYVCMYIGLGRAVPVEHTWLGRAVPVKHTFSDIAFVFFSIFVTFLVL